MAQEPLEKDNLGQEDTAQPVFSFTYRISLDNYRDFNLMLVEYSMGKNKRKMRIFGVLELLVGGLMLCSCFFSQTPVHALYYVMGFVLLPLGVFSLLYHPLIFPKQMKKSIEKTYRESEYLNGPLTLRLYPHKVEDSWGHLTGSAQWKEMVQVVESPENFLVMLPGGKGLILPKEAAGEQRDQVEGFLKEVCRENGKQYSVLSWRKEKKQGRRGAKGE